MSLRDGVHQRVTPLGSLFLLCKQESDLANRSKETQRPSNLSPVSCQAFRARAERNRAWDTAGPAWRGKRHCLVKSWVQELSLFTSVFHCHRTPSPFHSQKQTGMAIWTGYFREKFSKIRGSHTSLREQTQEQIQLKATYHNQRSLSIETHLERRKELRKNRHMYRKAGVGPTVHTLMEWH